MAASLGRYGQLSPLAVCLREERPEVLDGFKRVAAGRTLPTVSALQAKLVVVDEPTAKAVHPGMEWGRWSHERSWKKHGSFKPWYGKTAFRNFRWRSCSSGIRAGSVVGWRFWNDFRKSAAKICDWGCCRRRWRGS